MLQFLGGFGNVKSKEFPPNSIINSQLVKFPPKLVFLPEYVHCTMSTMATMNANIPKLPEIVCSNFALAFTVKSENTY